MTTIPKPKHDDGGAGDFPPFLKATHIGKVGSKAVAMLTGEAVRIVDGTFGKQMIVPVKVGKQVYDWSVTLDTPNHRELADRFGTNPKKWKGKKLTLTVNPPIRKGYRPYVAISREK